MGRWERITKSRRKLFFSENYKKLPCGTPNALKPTCSSPVIKFSSIVNNWLVNTRPTSLFILHSARYIFVVEAFKPGALSSRLSQIYHDYGSKMQFSTKGKAFLVPPSFQEQAFPKIPSLSLTLGTNRPSVTEFFKHDEARMFSRMTFLVSVLLSFQWLRNV